MTEPNFTVVPSSACNSADRSPCKKRSSVDLTETSTSSRDPVGAVVSTDPSQLRKYSPRSVAKFQVVRNRSFCPLAVRWMHRLDTATSRKFQTLQTHGTRILYISKKNSPSF